MTDDTKADTGKNEWKGRTQGNGAADKKPATLDDFWFIDERKIPPRPWIVYNFLGRGMVSELVGGAGTGKSLFALALALHIAMGRDYGPLITMPKEGLPKGTPTRYNVAIAAAEEDDSEIMRRMVALSIYYQIANKDLKDGKDRSRVRFMNFHGRAPVLIKIDASGNPEETEDFKSLRKQVLEMKADVVVLDPLVELWEGGNENDNAYMKGVLAIFRKLAREANASVFIIHHMGKAVATSGDMNSGRGSSSIVGAIRGGRTLLPMTEAQADEIGISHEEAASKVCLSRKGKLNYGKREAGRDMFFDLVSVELMNATNNFAGGDETGVCVPWDPPAAKAITPAMIDGLLIEIDKGVLDASGQPTGVRWADKADSSRTAWDVVPMIASHLNITGTAAKALLKELRNKGRLVSKIYQNPKTRKQVLGLARG